MWSTRCDCANFQDSACSRPPLPTRSIRSLSRPILTDAQWRKMFCARNVAVPQNFSFTCSSCCGETSVAVRVALYHSISGQSSSHSLSLFYRIALHCLDVGLTTSPGTDVAFVACSLQTVEAAFYRSSPVKINSILATYPTHVTVTRLLSLLVRRLRPRFQLKSALYRLISINSTFHR